MYYLLIIIVVIIFQWSEKNIICFFFFRGPDNSREGDTSITGLRFQGRRNNYSLLF